MMNIPATITAPPKRTHLEKKIGVILTLWESIFPPSDILIRSSLFVKNEVFENEIGRTVLP